MAQLIKDLNEKNTQALEIVEDLPARVLRIVLVLYDSVPVSQKAVRDGISRRIKKTWFDRNSRIDTFPCTLRNIFAAISGTHSTKKEDAM